MAKLENRNNVRLANEIEILNLLRKKDRTISEIADQLDISFTAASNIIDELKKTKLVEAISLKESAKKRGRSPVTVKINTNNGLICGIDLSGWDIRIFLCTLDCKILCQKDIPSVMFINPEHLPQIEGIINELLKSDSVKGMKLLSICISSPGLINQETSKYEEVFRIPHYKEMDPVKYFKNAFNVNVEMYNDIRLGALAELKFGSFPSKPFNGIFLHIGTATGCAIVLNGKVYCGSNGFAGEFASFNETDTYSKTFAGRIYGIYDILKSEHKELPVLELEGDEKSIFDTLMKRYNAKDPSLLKKIDESISMNAIEIINLCSSLDIEYLVIEGPILKFGKYYIDTLIKKVFEYSKNKIRTKIVPSSLEENSTILGTAYQGVTSYFLKTLEDLTKKRIKKEDFKINKAFYEI